MRIALHRECIWEPEKTAIVEAVAVAAEGADIEEDMTDDEGMFNILENTGRPYRHHLLNKIFGSGAYRGPHRFFPTNRLYIAYNIGVIFKVTKI